VEKPAIQAFAIPAFGPNVVGAPIAHATKMPMRVLLNNDGATLCFVALRVQSLMEPGNRAAQIPPGASRVFTLAPGDTLFAISAGAGGVLNGEISEAVPLPGAVL
jgi:hypothetical protein